nr:MAG TPA: hypothetical protein [Inoviridae sp.]
MLLRDSNGRSVEFHLYCSSGIDFAEDWLNAGCLPRDEDGAYLVNDIDYIIDYAKDAIDGRNSDIEGKLDAELVVL